MRGGVEGLWGGQRGEANPDIGVMEAVGKAGAGGRYARLADAFDYWGGE